MIKTRRECMANGFTGKILWVDLSLGQIRDEPLDETGIRREVHRQHLRATTRSRVRSRAR
jgi:hypothetical protein